MTSAKIVPVLTCVGFGCIFGVVMLTRAAVTSPDAVIDKRNNPTPWLNIKPNQQVKLYPVTACVLFGCVLGAGYLLRMAVKHPDAAWGNKRSEFPWLHVKPNEQKKFYSSFDYSKLQDNKPQIE